MKKIVKFEFSIYASRYYGRRGETRTKENYACQAQEKQLMHELVYVLCIRDIRFVCAGFM